MEYIKINRLRGDVADFTITNLGMRISFAGKQPKNPPIDLTEEQCQLFLNELTEAMEVFYGNNDDTTDDTEQPDENNGAEEP